MDVPVSRDAVRSPELSDIVTVPRSPLALSSPKESLALTGSPAGTATPRSSEQFPAWTKHWGLRASPPAVNPHLNEGRAKLLLRYPRTTIRWPEPARTVRSPLLSVTRACPPDVGTLNPTGYPTWLWPAR